MRNIFRPLTGGGGGNWTANQELAANRLILEQATCSGVGCSSCYTRSRVRSNYKCAFLGLFIGLPMFLYQLVIFSTLDDMNMAGGAMFITLLISVGSITILVVTFCTCGWKYVWDRHPPAEVEQEAQRMEAMTMTTFTSTPGGQCNQTLAQNPLPITNPGIQPPQVYPQPPPSYNVQPQNYGAPPPPYSTVSAQTTTDPNYGPTFNYAAPAANYGAPYPLAQPYQGASVSNNAEQQPKRKNFVSDVFSNLRKGKK